MSRSIVKWFAAGAVLAAAGSALGYPLAANQVVTSVAPVINSSGREFIGPLAQIQVSVPANAILTDVGNPVTEIRLVGLNAAGVEVAAYSVPAGEVQGGFPNVGAGGAIANIQLNLNTSTNDDFLYNAALGITSIGVTVADAMSAAGDAGRVASIFNAAAEMGVGGDSCFELDSTPPRLINAYIQGTQFFAVFDEPLNLTSGGFGVNVAMNETTLPADATDVDFQHIASPGPFNFVDATPAINAAPNTANLGNGNFVGSNNSVIQYPAAVLGNVVVGGQVRPTATGGGVTSNNAITDIVGNRAVQASPTAGVTITVPPTFAVQSVEWVASYTNLGAAPGAQANTLRVIYTLPIGASAGSNTFYQGNNAGATSNLRRGGADSTLDLGTAAAPMIDPTNPNAVLVSIGAGTFTETNADNVWADGRDTLGNQFTWNYNTGIGVLPMDIFGTNLGAPPATPFNVGDRILPTQQYIGFADRMAGAVAGQDGKLDATIIAYDEPVTSNATTGTFTLRKVGATVQPVLQIMPNGALVNDTVVADAMPANNVIAVTGVAVGDGPMAAGVPARLQIGNAVIASDNPDNTNWDNDAATANGSAAEAIPGTAGPSARTIESTAAFTVTDANANVLTVPVFAATPVANDVAPPFITALWFLTGDNVEGGFQLANEQDFTLGDGLGNNSLVFVGSEPFGGPAVNHAQVGIGAGGAIVFDNFFGGNGAAGGAFGNLMTFFNSTGGGGVASAALVPGVQASIRPGSGITDGAGNESRSANLTSVDRTAPYIPLAADVNGALAFSAFYTDSNNDGFANTIRLTFTQPMDTATVQTTDFTLGVGTITGVAVEGSEVVLTVTDGVIPTAAATQVTYNATTDTMRLASLASAGGTGASVDAVAPAGTGAPAAAGIGNNDNRFNAQRVAPSNLPTQNVAFMDVVGQIRLNSDSGTDFEPAGTKVYAMIAAPHVVSVTATHNNIPFTINQASAATIDNGGFAASLNAWNRWLFGLTPNLYLGRNAANNQFYRINKSLGAQAGSAESTTRDVIALNINASNLTNITFTGTGETSTDKVTNGRASLAWDVLRSAGGTIQAFYGGGPVFGGQPIVSSAVVTGTDGRFELHISAPISAFDGLNRLNSIDRPVILIVERANGQRFAVSSVLSSVNGAPLRFRAQNRTQTSGSANDATTFNINLGKVGTQPIYSGWNLLAFDRAGGHATTTSTRPVLPNGVATGDVVIPTTATPLPSFAGPMEQFVYFIDPNFDGMWTRTEDAVFANVIIDPDIFQYFAFTMTSFGVQFGGGMTNFVGGYAAGFFNPGTFAANFGCFQFGARLSDAAPGTLFNGASAATTFPNNTTTQGWGLFTSPREFTTPVDMRAANGGDLDFIFLFRNNGPNAAALNRTAIEVSSLDLTDAGGSSNPNDTTVVQRGQPFFGHFQP